MSSTSAVQIIFGTAGVEKFDDAEVVYQVLSKHGVKTLDTAHIYGNSEATLGSTNAPKQFKIDTKAPGFRPGCLSAENVDAAMTKSLKDLKVNHVDVYYLHSPDPQTPLEQTLSTINDLHVAGKFKKFGLSNFDPEGVQQVHEIASKNKWVLPTVYQGNYNPAARHIETELFPLLRKYGITFNAYSPLAGGFLVKSKEQLSNPVSGGRFDPKEFTGQLYMGMYGKPSLIDALSYWEKIANDAGISKAALCYRWVAYHSALKGQYGDGMIIGASRISQMEETLKACEEGPLPESAVKGIEEFWQMVKDEAPVNNYEHIAKK